MIFHIETDHFKHRNTMNTDVDWVATLDCYDGAPDTQGIFAAQGHGKTEMAAIEDLVERLDGEEIYINLSAIGVEGECDPYDYCHHIQTVKAEQEKEKAQAYAEDNGLNMAQALKIGAT